MVNKIHYSRAEGSRPVAYDICFEDDLVLERRVQPRWVKPRIRARGPKREPALPSVEQLIGSGKSAVQGIDPRCFNGEVPSGLSPQADLDSDLDPRDFRAGGHLCCTNIYFVGGPKAGLGVVLPLEGDSSVSFAGERAEPPAASAATHPRPLPLPLRLSQPA